MTFSRVFAAAIALTILPVPATATSFITDQITDPANNWAGIDYWGVQVSAFSPVDQTLTFSIPDDSKVDIFMTGASKLQFTDVVLNGQSIAGNFMVDGLISLKATGFAVAGPTTLRFLADYDCKHCWGDWFGGYVQITRATIPAAPFPSISGPVPELSTWAMLAAGMGALGIAMRRRTTRVNFA